jgi:ankyrin repeat protein
VIRLIVAACVVSLAGTSAEAGPRELIAAIGAGSLSAMNAELVSGTDPDGETEKPPMATWLPVYLAAEAGRADMLALLVKFGADIDLRDTNGDRPLDWAARYGETEIVRLLLAAGAKPNPEEIAYINVPLVEALNGGHFAAADLLIEAGASVNRADDFDGTALYNAASSDNVAMVERLLRLGADPATPGPYFDHTPLHAAAMRSTARMIEVLVAAGAPLEARSRDRETPLFLAAKHGRLEAVRALLAAGADVDATDNRQATPLIAAMAWRRPPDWEKGIDEGVATNRDLAAEAALVGWSDHAATVMLLAEQTSDLHRALATAVWAGYGEAAMRLIARGARAIATDDHMQVRDDGSMAVLRHDPGPWVLAGAILFPGLDMFDLLRANGASLEAQGKDALLAAALAGRADIARRLLDAAVPVDGRDALGNTPLLLAATEGHVDVVQLLIGRGADPAATNAQGNGVRALMANRIQGYICIAKGREASRAFKPTDHIHAMAVGLSRRHDAVIAVLGIDAPSGPEILMAADTTCTGYD